MIKKAYKFRFYPTNNQKELLSKTFGCVRFVWNNRVSIFNDIIQDNETKQYKTIKELKEDFDFLKEVPYNALEQKLQDWEQTKRQYFNKTRVIKIGRPKYKSKKNKQSFRLSYVGFSIKNNNLILSKIGGIKIKGYDISSLPINTCKQLTISKESSGKYYCSILIETDIKPKTLTGHKIGIDFGLKDLFILSDGHIINNPKWFRENQSKLKRAQQHLSRKQKDSGRYKKQKIKVARIYEKIRFLRNNFFQEISTAIVNNYDVISIEDLNVRGMLKNRSLGKAISDASWSSFTTMLDYKCNWYGKTLIKIDRFYPSSKTCNNCGNLINKLSLNDREWTCCNCNVTHNRDINAAINIDKKGFSDLCGEPIKFNSVEHIENSRGEAVRPMLFSNNHHLASSVKRLNLSYTYG